MRNTSALLSHGGKEGYGCWYIQTIPERRLKNLAFLSLVNFSSVQRARQRCLTFPQLCRVTPFQAIQTIGALHSPAGAKAGLRLRYQHVQDTGR